MDGDGGSSEARKSVFKANTVFSLGQLDKLVEHFAKDYFKAQLTLQNTQDNSYQGPSQAVRDSQLMSTSMGSTLESLLMTLQQRLRVVFAGAQEAFRFFDISGSQKCSKEQFVYCCNYVQVQPVHLMELVELF
jgi:hypothetical protein